MSAISIKHDANTHEMQMEPILKKAQSNAKL